MIFRVFIRKNWILRLIYLKDSFAKHSMFSKTNFSQATQAKNFICSDKKIRKKLLR